MRKALLVMTMLCLGGLVFGCAALKAGDTTQMTADMTKGETHVTYTVLPTDLVADPNSPLYGRLLAIPTVPGKDVTVDVYYETGQPLCHLATKRTDVLAALWSGAATADQMKFVQDQWMMEQVMTRIDSLVAMFAPVLQQRLAVPPAPADGGLCNADGTCKAGFKAQLLSLIQEALAAQAAKQ